jgi:hypothetical protein
MYHRRLIETPTSQSIRKFQLKASKGNCNQPDQEAKARELLAKPFAQACLGWVERFHRRARELLAATTWESRGNHHTSMGGSGHTANTGVA